MPADLVVFAWQLAREGPVAEATVEWSLPCMCSQVMNEVRSLRETAGAQVAPIWPLAGVYAKVCCQVATRRKEPVAVATPVQLSVHVFGEAHAPAGVDGRDVFCLSGRQVSYVTVRTMLPSYGACRTNEHM